MGEDGHMTGQQTDPAGLQANRDKQGELGELGNSPKVLEIVGCCRLHLMLLLCRLYGLVKMSAHVKSSVIQRGARGGRRKCDRGGVGRGTGGQSRQGFRVVLSSHVRSFVQMKT